MKRRLISLLLIFFVMACNMPALAAGEEEVQPFAILPSDNDQQEMDQDEGNTEAVSPRERNEPDSSRVISQQPYPSEENLPASIPSAETELNIPLYVYNDAGHARTDSPVTSGVPFPLELQISDIDSLKLVDSGGNPVAAQFTAVARWGTAIEDTNGALRWVWLDFPVSLEGNSGTYFFLQQGGPGPEPQYAISLSETPDEIVIDTGAERFSISKTDGLLRAPHLTGVIGSRVIDNEMDVYQAGGTPQIQVNVEGPLRTSISVSGSYLDENGNALLDYTSRYWFYVGLPLLRLFHTIENNTPCPLMEYEQVECFDIGSDASVSFHDASIELQLETDGELQYSIYGDGEPAAGALTADLLLYQDSSGTAFWDTYPNLTDWDGNPLDTRPRMQSYVSLPGYQTSLGNDIIESGSQALGILTLSGNNVQWSVGVRDFWQNFPKALQATPDGNIQIHLFPSQYGGEGYDFNLRAGEHKTHEIWLSASAELSLAPAPLFAQAMPAWYVDSGAFGLTALRDEDTWPEHEQYLDDQLNTSVNHSDNWDVYENLFDAIERTDFYGIFDYGDLPIDYEGYGVSPLNPKYDFDYGMWLQWARGTDARWFDLAQAADRHAADIDLLHTLHNPRHWSDGNMFGHSYHDEDGFANPHRNYGGLTPDTAFGMDGMLLLYYLTGYEKSYESAQELADYIEFRLHNDDYLCGYYSEGECNGTGYALFDGLYNAGARPAANSLSIAVAAYRATSDPRYWTVATALVQWAAPENQPYINGPTGGHNDEDHMRPWMMNMYLRALSQYIEAMDEYGLPDDAGAREAYLTYADWLHRYAWIELEPIESGKRAAYPYQWWFDERQGDPNDEYSIGNNVVSINNWLYLGADAMAYAYDISGDEQYLEWAAELFRTGSHDEFYPDDESLYTETKQTINALTYGNIFLYEWQLRE